MKRTISAVTFAGILGLAGCSASNAADSAAGKNGASGDGNQPAAAPVVAPPPALENPPTPTLSDTDAVALLQKFQTFENELLMKPDSSAVASYLDPNCPCFKDTFDSISGLEKDEQHYASPWTTLDGLTVTSRDPVANLIVVSGFYQTDPVDVLDKNDVYVGSAPTVPRTAMDTTLGMTDNGWRIVDVQTAEEQQVPVVVPPPVGGVVP